MDQSLSRPSAYLLMSGSRKCSGVPPNVHSRSNVVMAYERRMNPYSEFNLRIRALRLTLTDTWACIWNTPLALSPDTQSVWCLVTDLRVSVYMRLLHPSITGVYISFDFFPLPVLLRNILLLSLLVFILSPYERLLCSYLTPGSHRS
jgi:hypothetical protein